VIGGPKLGKTSLVRTALNGLADRTVIEMDLGTDPSPRFELVPRSIVVLDNLDGIADSAIESLLARVSAAGASGVVVTGGRRLRTLLGHSRTGASVSFRLYPCSAGRVDGKPSLPDEAVSPLWRPRPRCGAIPMGAVRPASGCRSWGGPRAAATVLPDRARGTGESHPGRVRHRHPRHQDGFGHTRLPGCHQSLDSERGGHTLRRLSAAQ